MRSHPMWTAPAVILLVAVVGVLAAGALPAQTFLLSRATGEQAVGQPVDVRGTGEDRVLVFATGDTQVVVPFAAVLGIHGPPPRVTAPVAAYLVGGDEWKGELEGGDRLGDHFILKSAALGTRQIRVDRLRTLVFRDRAPGSGPEAFALAADSKFQEALFRKARRGFDMLGGELECFTGKGISFVLSGRNTPRNFAAETLTALTVRGGEAAQKPGSWQLVTTSGDRLRVELIGVDPKKMEFATEFGTVALPLAQVAALTQIREDRAFLSDLEPQRVEEVGSADELGADPLFRFQRDRTVSAGVVGAGHSPADGYLVAGGHTYAKGLGVHSRCVLTFRVPEKMTRFHALVAIDDEVKSLGVKGDVDVSVRQGDTVLFAAKGLQRGQPPRSLGLLEVTPGALLSLEVDFGKGMFLGDRVDWLTAVFLR